jgi:protease-4
MTTDLVKAGQHADLGFGMTLPLIGAGVPDRNLTPEEFGLMERMIKTFYKGFVAKVADGRKMSSEDVDRIGQGRAWPGVDGKQNGLVDELGGLETALLLAKQGAGIARDAAVKIVELPQPELLNFGMFTPKLIGFAGRLGIGGILGLPGDIGRSAAVGAQLAADPMLEDLRFRLERNGRPMLLLPMDDLDMIKDAQAPIGN